MKTSHLRIIISIKKFLNSNSVINFIVISIVLFLIIIEAQKNSYTENIETIRLTFFAVIVALSFTISFGLVSRLYKSKKEVLTGIKKKVLNRSYIIIGSIAIVVLTVISEFPIITLYAIGFGLTWGILYGIFKLLGKQGLKIWDFFIKHKRQKMFEYFANRPENRRRNSTNKE